MTARARNLPRHATHVWIGRCPRGAVIQLHDVPNLVARALQMFQVRDSGRLLPGRRDVARHLSERLVHPWRRRGALRRLERVSPVTLLVACHGNICRSPFAAGLLGKELHGRGVRVESAGFVAPDRPPPAEALAAAARRGVDLSNHRSRLLGNALVRSADLIVVMEPAQRRAMCDRFGCPPGHVVVLGDLDPEPIDTRGIRDPVDKPAEVFEECYARIERCVRELVRAMTGGPEGPR